MKALLIAAVTVLLISTACSDGPSDPVDPVNPVNPELEVLYSTYEVATVDGRTTPFILSETDTSTAIYVGGWLTLHENKRYEMETDIQAIIYNNGDRTTRRQFNWGTYEVSSDSLYFKPIDQELYFDFQGHIRGGRRHRIQAYVYGVEYTFERLEVSESFDKKKKQRLVESALRELQILDGR